MANGRVLRYISAFVALGMGYGFGVPHVGRPMLHAAAIFTALKLDDED